MGRKLYHGGVGHIHDIARFFEVLNGGSSHPDYDLTTKPTSGRMLRAHPTRAMKKREAMAREEATFHTSFPDLADCEIFVPQQRTGTEHDDISRETTTAPAQWKAKVAAGEWFNLRRAESLPAAPTTASAGCASRKHMQIIRAISKFNMGCNPLATSLSRHCPPPKKDLFPKSYFIFLKSQYTNGAGKAASPPRSARGQKTWRKRENACKGGVFLRL